MHDLASAGVELAVVVAYGRIIPARLLEEMPMVNLHFSLLPRWRGAAPVERAILAGDRETGVCLMKVEAGLDTGPVYAVRRVPLDDDITLDEVRHELVTVASALLVEALAHGVSGLPHPEPQQGEVTMAEKITKEDLHLDWTAPASALKRVVRLGRAWTTFRGTRLRVLEAALGPDRHGPDERPPGSLDGPLVATGGGSLVLRRVQPESRSPMSAEEWLRGVRPGGRRASRDGLDMRAVTVTPIDGWSPDQYERFRSERQQPFDDLLMLCHPVPGGRVVDLGCGTGDLTKILHEEMEAKETVGIDSSPPCWPGPRRPTATWPGSRSPRVTSPPGSTRASTWCSPTHHCSGSTTTSTCWPACAPRSAPTASWPSRCRPTTATRHTCWRTRWPTSRRSSTRSTGTSPRTGAASSSHPSSTPTSSTNWGRRIRSCAWRSTATSSSRRARWSSGSWGPCSRPYRKRLSPELFDEFIERYRERLIEELGEREPYFYGFRRILCWARFS